MLSEPRDGRGVCRSYLYSILEVSFFFKEKIKFNFTFFWSIEFRSLFQCEMRDVLRLKIVRTSRVPTTGK